jgi:hypothetical protein
MNRRYVLATGLLFLFGSILSAVPADARGGGGGRGGGGRGGGGRGGGGGHTRMRNTGGKPKDHKDVEAARERLRQSDYRDRDAPRDRPAV